MVHGNRAVVDAAIAVLLVFSRAGLSPGKQAAKHASRIDQQRKYHKLKASSRSGKRQRLSRKKLRFQTESTNELREGVTYCTNVCMEDQPADTSVIPPPTCTANPTVMSPTDASTSNRVFYDLETTGLGFRPDIIQIAACVGDQTYNSYIMPPAARIPSKVTDITGLSIRGSAMFSRGNQVDTTTIKVALQNFVDFLPQSCVLVGHNITAFDNRIIYLHLVEDGLQNEFAKKVSGFTDTLHLAKAIYPERKVYKQEALASDMGIEYEAHNAQGDVEALQKLFSHMAPTPSLLSQHTMGSESVIKSILSKVRSRENKSSLQGLTSQKVLSDSMANKVASSGLRLEHLKLAFKRGGLSGISELFSERTDNGVRVTKSKQIIQRVATYLDAK